jgi:hypothetical protein
LPFGKYADFDACVRDQSKDHDIESAKAICGKMQAEMGGSNFVSQELDANGDLYLKYFFADSSYTERVPFNGRFSIDKNALALKDKEAIGLPFSILPRKDLAINNDWHPWNPTPGASWDDHVAFAKSFSLGHIAAITPDTQLTGGAIDSIKQNNGRFAIIKITDKRARDAFVKDPSLIPRAVSPGFLNKEVPNRENIKNFQWVHLAAVPQGAYGDKATVYASCLGGDACVDHLVGASVAELYEKAKDTYCPVGASQTISSLGNFSTDSQIMSDNANTVAAPTPTSAVAPVSPTPPKEIPKGAPITTATGTPKGIIRLKDKNAVPQQGNQQPTNDPQVDDLGKLKEEVAKMREIQQQNERREQIKRLIPKELFINKGKFDEKAFEAEVEKRLASGASDEQINELYTLWMDKQKLINAGYTIPQANAELNQPQPQVSMSAPTGGSAYVTPNEVPGELTGGSANDIALNAVSGLLKSWRRGL